MELAAAARFTRRGREITPGWRSPAVEAVGPLIAPSDQFFVSGQTTRDCLRIRSYGLD
jgi:hypothetical protein